MHSRALQLLYIDQGKIEREKPQVSSGVASHHKSVAQRLNLMRQIKLCLGWLFTRTSSQWATVLLLVFLLGSRSVLASPEAVPATQSPAPLLFLKILSLKVLWRSRQCNLIHSIVPIRFPGIGS
jgi:hypothetical protein